MDRPNSKQSVSLGPACGATPLRAVLSCLPRKNTFHAFRYLVWLAANAPVPSAPSRFRRGKCSPSERRPQSSLAVPEETTHGKHRQTDRRTDKRTDIQTDRQTETETERQGDKKTERQADRQTGRHQCSIKETQAPLSAQSKNTDINPCSIENTDGHQCSLKHTQISPILCSTEKTQDHPCST